MERGVLEHVIEIKERLASIDEKLERASRTEEKVEYLEHDVTAAKASIKTLQWVIGVCFGVAGLLVGVAKAMALFDRG